MASREHPVAAIIHHCQKHGDTVPEFRDIGGRASDPNGVSWWVRVNAVWSHVLFIGKRQFVDGVEL